MYSFNCGLCTFRVINHFRVPLQWRHDERDGVSNHKPHDCLPKRSFRHRWEKTSKLRVTGLCEGNSPLTGEFPHKEPVSRKMFPFDDVIMRVRVQLYASIASNNGPVPNSRLAIIWTIDSLDCWRMYASFSLYVLWSVASHSTYHHQCSNVQNQTMPVQLKETSIEYTTWYIISDGTTWY